MRKEFIGHFNEYSAPRRRTLRLLAALPFATVTTPARTSSFELRVITGGGGDATARILQSIEHRWPGTQSSNDAKSLAARKGLAVYVAIGPAALANALDVELISPLISLFTSNEAYTRLIASRPPSPAHRMVTAIYAEASPSQQMLLIRRLYGRSVRVGVLLSERTAHMEAAIRVAARAAMLDVEVQELAAGENILRALARLSAATVLLALPDSSIYTPESLRDILESTYRRNQAVVGFSTALVDAGTLATAYSSIDDTLAQLGEVADALVAGRYVEPQYPTYWRVAINDSVARSLDVVVEDDVRLLGHRPP